MSHDDILLRLLQGDKDAFALFCVHILPILLRQQERRCRRWNLSVDLAEDILQEAIIKAFQWSQTNTKEIKNPSHLFNKIATNLTFTWAKLNAKHHQVSLEEFHKVESDDILTRIAIRDALEQLKPADRDILRLILEQGYSTPEVADRLKIEPWAVYKRYERALAKLRRMLT